MARRSASETPEAPKLRGMAVTAAGARALKYRVPDSDLDTRFYWPDSSKGFIVTDEDGDAYALFPHVLGGVVIFHSGGMDHAPCHATTPDEQHALFYDRAYCTLDMALAAFRCWATDEPCSNGDGEEWEWLDYPRQIASKDELRERDGEDTVE